MTYTVFLVEDEIVAREGMRNNVNWSDYGFALCGEAADGELALPYLERLQPDLLITDIRMPFMDGLQLARLVRERLPHTKIVIISGYDDFGYAQEAIKLGVTEYLLKPIGAQDVAEVLQRIGSMFDSERVEAQRRRLIEQQLLAVRPLLREHFLLQLVMGKIDTLEAITRSSQFELDLLATCYRVVVARIEPPSAAHGIAPQPQIETLLAKLNADRQDVLVCRKDSAEILFIVKAQDESDLTVQSNRLAMTLQAAVEDGAFGTLMLGQGAIESRLGDLHRSYLAACTGMERKSGTLPLDVSEVLPLPDHTTLETFLTAGAGRRIDEFVADQINPWRMTIERSPLTRDYLLLDIYLTAGRLIEEWGGDLHAHFPELADFSILAATVQDFAGFEVQYRHVIAATIAYRNRTVDSHQHMLVQEARAYIDAHYAVPEISLGSVAAHLNLSPSHLSAVFSRENGASFKEYLTHVRIRHAKELLRGSTLRGFEIAEAVGYVDPHYFSTVFKKVTGRSPREFRNGR